METPTNLLGGILSPTSNVLESGHHVLSNFYENLTVIGLVVLAMIAIATPIIKMIQKTNSENNNQINRNDTESYLYQHLKEQIENQKQELALARDENNRLWEMIKGLEARLCKLEHLERNFDELKVSLNIKDNTIVELNAKIVELEKRNIALQVDNELNLEQIKQLQYLLKKCTDS